MKSGKSARRLKRIEMGKMPNECCTTVLGSEPHRTDHLCAGLALRQGDASSRRLPRGLLEGFPGEAPRRDLPRGLPAGVFRRGFPKLLSKQTEAVSPVGRMSVRE